MTLNKCPLQKWRKSTQDVCVCVCVVGSLGGGVSNGPLSGTALYQLSHIEDVPLLDLNVSPSGQKLFKDLSGMQQLLGKQRSSYEWGWGWGWGGNVKQILQAWVKCRLTCVHLCCRALPNRKVRRKTQKQKNKQKKKMIYTILNVFLRIGYEQTISYLLQVAL